MNAVICESNVTTNVCRANLWRKNEHAGCDLGVKGSTRVYIYLLRVHSSFQSGMELQDETREVQEEALVKLVCGLNNIGPTMVRLYSLWATNATTIELRQILLPLSYVLPTPPYCNWKDECILNIKFEKSTLPSTSFNPYLHSLHSILRSPLLLPFQIRCRLLK